MTETTEADRVHDMLMESIDETVRLQERIIACETPEQFQALRAEIKAQWDADVAMTRATVEKAIARFKSHPTETEGRV